MRRARAGRWLAGFCGMLVLAACGAILEPDREWERVIGVIEIGGEQPAPVALPAEVRRGEAFTATLTTWGSGTCTRPDGADVQIRGATAELVPFDRQATTGACTDDLRAYPREIGLRFDVAGEATVRVTGRPVIGGSIAVYETRITVLP